MSPSISSVLITTVAALSALNLAGCQAETQTPPTDPSTAEAKQQSCNATAGNKAPQLSIHSVNGAGSATITPGKVTLVDFWATWCGPCEKSFPKYQDLYTKYHASGFDIIAVAMDDEATGVPGWVKARKAKFPVGWDEGHKLAKCWKPSAMPTSYLIDKKGIIRHVDNEWHDGNEKKVEQQIKELL